MGKIHFAKEVFHAARGWAFTLTILSVALGSVMAFRTGQFHWGRGILVLISMILAHAGANLMNDYGDFKHGVDAEGAPTTIYRRHPILSGAFSPAAVFKMSLFCYALCLLASGYFFWMHGWPILVLAVLGGLGGICYTMGPKYKYRAMGEAAVFLLWGPLMVCGTYFVHSGTMDPILPVLIISIPHGLWVVLVLLANNLADIDYDRKANIHTLGTVLGKSKALSLYFYIVLAIYIITALKILTGVIPVWGILTGLSFPMIYKFILRLRRETDIPPDVEPQTARAVVFYGALLTITLLISA